jgi:hypothetical protein
LYSPREAIFSLSLDRDVAAWRRCRPFDRMLLLLLVSFSFFIVDAAVVIRCVCGASLSVVHAGVLVRHVVASYG